MSFKPHRHIGGHIGWDYSDEGYDLDAYVVKIAFSSMIELIANLDL